jgi:hypothetical protein
MSEFDLYATPYVYDPENAERAKRGAAACRLALAGKGTGIELPLDSDDPIRDAALRRAREERRAA